jgi:hypothetical protein
MRCGGRGKQSTQSLDRTLSEASLVRALATSPDLIHWSKPVLAITQNQLLQREPEGNWSYAYFSLIDPKSTDPNYSMITDDPYLYHVRSDENHGPYKRVLFRQKIKLNWLATSHQK